MGPEADQVCNRDEYNDIFQYIISIDNFLCDSGFGQLFYGSNLIYLFYCLVWF